MPDSLLNTWQVGAAVLGVAVKPTIKQVDGSGRVLQTLQRAGLWEVQTPQVGGCSPLPCLPDGPQQAALHASHSHWIGMHTWCCQLML